MVPGTADGLSRGATIRGRLVQCGKVVPDAEIGLGNKERHPGEHFPESRIGTRPAADGRSEFRNVPTGEHKLWAAVKGYRLSYKNPNLSWVVEGRIDRTAPTRDVSSTLRIA
jgi:hypothetical protein